MPERQVINLIYREIYWKICLIFDETRFLHIINTIHSLEKIIKFDKAKNNKINKSGIYKVAYVLF